VEEIAMQNRDLFLAAGGTQFRYIPALNDSDAHIQALAQIIMEHL
jgi:ferrochelatase